MPKRIFEDQQEPEDDESSPRVLWSGSNIDNNSEEAAALSRKRRRMSLLSQQTTRNHLIHLQNQLELSPDAKKIVFGSDCDTFTKIADELPVTQSDDKLARVISGLEPQLSNQPISSNNTDRKNATFGLTVSSTKRSRNSIMKSFLVDPWLITGGFPDFRPLSEEKIESVLPQHHQNNDVRKRKIERNDENFLNLNNLKRPRDERHEIIKKELKSVLKDESEKEKQLQSLLFHSITQ